MKKQNKPYSPFICFDLETGGLDENKNPIIELAFIAILRDKQGNLYIDEALSFNSLVLPYDKKLVIEEEALKVNKITLEVLKEKGNKAETIIEVLLEMIGELNPTKNEKYKPILVGHNIDSFDKKFLKHFLKVCKAPDLETLFDSSTIDTYKISKLIFEGADKIDSLKLENVCRYFDIKMKNSHRAYDDAFANAQLFIKFQNLLSLERRFILELKNKEKK